MSATRCCYLTEIIKNEFALALAIVQTNRLRDAIERLRVVALFALGHHAQVIEQIAVAQHRRVDIHTLAAAERRAADQRRADGGAVREPALLLTSGELHALVALNETVNQGLRGLVQVLSRSACDAELDAMGQRHLPATFTVAVRRHVLDRGVARHRLPGRRHLRLEQLPALRRAILTRRLRHRLADTAHGRSYVLAVVHAA